MAKKKARSTVSSYSYEETNDPNLKRFVDFNGNWTHYFVEDEKRYVKAVNHILHLGYNKGPRFAEYLLSVTKDEAKKKLETAGEEGTRTHHAIRDLIDGLAVKMNTKYMNELTGRQEVLMPDELKNLMAFEAWCEVYHPRVISNDMAIYSKKHSYAGSPDAMMIITVPDKDKNFPKKAWGTDVFLMPDWKTSSAIHKEYKSQVAAYYEAIVEGGKFDQFLNEYEVYTGIVRFGTRHKNGGWEMETWDEKGTKENFKRFLAAKMIAEDHEKDFEPFIEEIPTEFFIKLPKAVIKRGKAKQSQSKAAKKKGTKRKVTK